MIKRTRRERRQERSGLSHAGGDSTRVGGAVPIGDHDPLMAYLLGSGGPVDVERLDLDSEAVRSLRAEGVRLVVPLVSQGELIGTLNLGPRLSDQPYSTDDRRLLGALASQAAPAIRLAQMVRQQEVQAKERERIEHELRVAALIQQTLLPKDLPSLPGWDIEAYYHPARAVGGDFYDFIPMSDGRLGVVIGDVTDKGVPAALVMATTRSTLRGEAQRHSDPGVILASTNDVLHGEIPPAMFVTCLFGILDAASGRFLFANAGHNLPYVRTSSGVIELRATGMPLGLMPGMVYDVVEGSIGSGETMLLSSDGIVEAHGPDGTMFGFPRLMGLVGSKVTDAESLTATVIADMDRFCGPGHEQEDDVTLVAIHRGSSAADSAGVLTALLDETDSFSVNSEPGNERVVMDRVGELAARLGMTGEPLERLKTAVSEAAMNAIEHGNGFDPVLAVDVSVRKHDNGLFVRIGDTGSVTDLASRAAPNLEAKLEGTQEPRGWGLFLIEQMVDELRHEVLDGRHVVEIRMNLEGAGE